MRIESLHPEGFGHFAGQEIGPFRAPLTVIHGHNEAGKSTLLAFVRTVLFGFPGQHRAKFYPPLAGGRHGGRITLVDEGGERYIVERTETKDAVSLRITLPDGSQSTDEGVLRRLLGHSSRPLFESVFAFGLLDLQRLDSFEKSEVAQQIYAAGMGAANLPKVQAGLEADAARLFQPRGSKQEAARILHELKEVDSELDRLRNEAHEYAEKATESCRLEAEIAEAGGASRAAAGELAEVETLARAWSDWVARDELRQALAALPEFRHFPEDAVSRLEHVTRALAESQESYTGLAAEIEALRERAARPIADAELLAAAGLAEDVRRQRGGLEHSINDLPKRTSELEALEARVGDGVRLLGPGWDEASVAAFDVSTPVRDAVERWAKELQRAEQAEHDAANRDDLAGEALREAAEREERAREALAKTPVPPLAASEIALRRDLLLAGRSRLSEVAAAANRRESLEAQQAILSAQQPAPVPQPQAPVLPAMVVGGVAVAVAGVGLLAGGAALIAGLALAVVLVGVAVWLARRRPAPPGAAMGTGLREVPGLAEARANETRARDAFLALAAALHCEPSAEAFNGVERLLGETEKQLERREATAERLKAEREERERVASRREEAARLVGEAREKLKAARTAWGSWLREHGLPPTIGPSTTLGMIGQIETLQEQIRGLVLLRDRVSKIGLDIEREAGQVGQLAALVGLRVDLANHAGILRTADELLGRFDAARSATEQRDHLNEQIEARSRDLESADRRLNAARCALAELFQACGAEDGEGVRLRAAQQAERRRVAGELANTERALRTLSGPGEQYERLLERLAATDRQAIAGRQAELAKLCEQIDERARASEQQLGAARERLKQLATDSRASALRAQRAVLVEQLGGVAEEWSRLTIAGVLLNRARAKFEKERQPEVVQAARSYFETMTRGRYARIHVPIGTHVIEAAPADGSASKQPHQLSQGTQEQLYLAMRFGLVEQFARQETNLPVVVDEILVNFDPERALAAACAFGQLARSHQVLVFTCHPWVVELFRRAESGTCVVELDGVARPDR